MRLAALVSAGPRAACTIDLQGGRGSVQLVSYLTTTFFARLAGPSGGLQRLPETGWQGPAGTPISLRSGVQSPLRTEACIREGGRGSGPRQILMHGSQEENPSASVHKEGGRGSGPPGILMHGSEAGFFPSDPCIRRGGGGLGLQTSLGTPYARLPESLLPSPSLVIP